MGHTIQVVAIRELDWYYCERPDLQPNMGRGNQWALLTLSCKEMENLLCEPKFLVSVFGPNISEHGKRVSSPKNPKTESLLTNGNTTEDPGSREVESKYDCKTKTTSRPNL